MTKLKFIFELHDKLSHLPQDEVEERINFYSEMIEDRMEEGLSEEEAVAAIGSVEKIAEEIEAEISGAKTLSEKVKPKRRLKAWEITLLALGSPVWLALLIAAAAVILSIYISILAVIVSLWAVFSALAASAVGICGGGIVFICLGHAPSGIAMIGAGLVCAGLSVISFFGCMAATKGIVNFTKFALKKLFAKKEGVK